MTKRLEVLLAVKALVQATFPAGHVLGLENEGDAPERIPPEGRFVIRAGDPGEPEVDLCPLTYNYQHQIPVEITRTAAAGQNVQQLVDADVGRLAAAIKANRTLGGLIDFLDGFSPSVDDIYTPGSPLAVAADLVLVAAYATTDPL